jgi:hypothetical protein
MLFARALTLQTKIFEIVTQLAERGSRIAAMETLVSHLRDAIHDPLPKAGGEGREEKNRSAFDDWQARVSLGSQYRDRALL